MKRVTVTITLEDGYGSTRKLRHEIMEKAIEVARQEGFTIRAVDSRLGHGVKP